MFSSALPLFPLFLQMACRYVDAPVLLQRPDVGPIKFDFRFYVLLHSAKPLKVSMHTKFVTRFANK